VALHGHRLEVGDQFLPAADDRVAGESPRHLLLSALQVAEPRVGRQLAQGPFDRGDRVGGRATGRVLGGERGVEGVRPALAQDEDEVHRRALVERQAVLDVDHSASRRVGRWRGQPRARATTWW
jgi:hypothetical protein